MTATAEPGIEARRTEWTPGPWRAAALLTGSLGERPQSYLIESLNGLHIAEVPDGYSANRRELATHRANAKLIAAGPELLAALKPLVAMFSPHAPCGCAACNARAAIAKATGADQ